MNKELSINSIIQSCSKITGVESTTIESCKAELINFLRKENAEDLILDIDDLEHILQLCCLYANIPMSDVLTESTIYEIAALAPKEELYKRVGNKIKLVDDPHRFNAIAQKITRMHPDLNYKLTEHQYRIRFYDNNGLVFEYGDFYAILAFKELSGSLTFHRFKLNEKAKVIPEPYLSDKAFVIDEGKKNVKVSFFTETEALDLLMNRNVITYGDFK